jgi:hypothetical protein
MVLRIKNLRPNRDEGCIPPRYHPAYLRNALRKSLWIALTGEPDPGYWFHRRSLSF